MPSTYPVSHSLRLFPPRCRPCSSSRSVTALFRIAPPPLLIHIRSNQLFHPCLHIFRSNIHRRIRIIQHLANQTQLSMAMIMSVGRRAPQVIGIRKGAAGILFGDAESAAGIDVDGFTSSPASAIALSLFLFFPTPKSAAPALPMILFG